MPYSTYLPEHMGSITLSLAGPFVAGSHAELTLVYTAGTFGIDDTGMVKISWRPPLPPPAHFGTENPALVKISGGTPPEIKKPQFDKPGAANYTTVEASN